MGGNTLTLAVKEKPDQKLIDQFAASNPQLVVDGVLGEHNSVLIGRRSDEVRDSFEIWSPIRAFEEGDLEPDLAALVPAPCWLFQITLETDPPKEDWEFANSFARFIAVACKGAVFYNELGKVVWPKAERKKASVSEKGRLVDLVNLEWFVHLSQPSVATARPFLASLRRLCPEAVPVRFGTVEPLQGRLQGEDDAPFEELWNKSNKGQTKEGLIMGMIHFTGKSPCFGGFVSFPPRLVGVGKKPEEEFVKFKLEFDRGPLNSNPNLCERVVNLFAGVAKNLKAFYGHSFVERNWSTYRGLSLMPKTEERPGTEQYPLPIGHQWFGIPPAPTWLQWLGPAYAELAKESLRNVDHVTSEDGIIIRRGPRPMDLDQLQGVTLDLPPRLLAQEIEDPFFKEKRGRWTYQGKPAELIPRLDS